MKQLMQRITGKAHLLFAAFLITTHVAAFAAPATGPDSPATANITVKHIGNVDNKMYFKVELENPTSEKFSIVVKDQTGNILFHETYNDKSFSKTFQLTKDDADKVTFVVRTSKNTSTQSFEINTNTRVVEEVVVRKVD